MTPGQCSIRCPIQIRLQIARGLSYGLLLVLSACASGSPPTVEAIVTPFPVVVAEAATTQTPAVAATATLTAPSAPTPTPTLTATNTPTPAPTQTLTPRPTLSPTPAYTPTPIPLDQAATSALTKAVILIIIDGARWTETFGDPTRELIPHLADDLALLGAINTAFYNDAATLSIPGHAAIVTGTWQDLPNDGTQRPSAPTVFEYLRRATGASENEAVFIHGSFIEPVLTYSIHPDYGADFGAGMFFSDYAAPPYDDGMWANARQVLAELHPRLMMISLLDPDEAGHEHNWEAYRQAIRHDDEIIWDLWQQVQGDPFYAGQTTLFVTNDHGRGCGEGWPDHGGSDECNRHVMFLAVGSKIQPGLVVTQRRTLRDITPTIGYLLGFETPLAEGDIMTELQIP